MNAHLLLVEGTCGTGKSTLIKNLLARHIAEEQRPRTLIHLSQAHTYFPLVARDLPDQPGKRQHREHLRHILRMLDWDYALQPRRWFTLFALIDTLHLTHAFRPAVLSWPEMGYVDQFLAGHGARIVLLRATPETLWQRLIVERGTDPMFLSHYQRKFGHSPEAVHAYYVQEQEEMLRLAAKSRVASLVLPAEDAESTLTAQAYGFWKS
jgi:hypothetical protein